MLHDSIIERLERAGDASSGAMNLAADIVELCQAEAMEETRFTPVSFDASTIDDLLEETVEQLRLKARP